MVWLVLADLKFYDIQDGIKYYQFFQIEHFKNFSDIFSAICVGFKFFSKNPKMSFSRSIRNTKKYKTFYI